MKVGYDIRIELETDDYIKSLEEIDDAIQDHVKGNPQVVKACAYPYRREEIQSSEQKMNKSE